MSPETVSMSGAWEVAVAVFVSAGFVLGLIYVSVSCACCFLVKRKGDEEQIKHVYVHINSRKKPAVFLSAINRLKRFAFNRWDTERDPEKGINSSIGKIQFTVTYNQRELSLTVNIIRAKDLPPCDINETRSCYVFMRILPDKNALFKTKIAKKSVNPVWDEKFTFEGWPRGQLIYRTIYLKLYDYDKYGEDEPIGEVYIPLLNLDLSNSIPTWKFLHPCKDDRGKLGEVLVCFSYLPGMKTIIINIRRARALKKIDSTGADPYMKIWLMYGNKRISKQKSEVAFNSLNPIYDQEFKFTVPKEHLHGASLAVYVMDNRSRNLCMGRVVFGTLSTGPPEVRHWNDMLGNPEEQVVRWHQPYNNKELETN